MDELDNLSDEELDAQLEELGGMADMPEEELDAALAEAMATPGLEGKAIEAGMVPNYKNEPAGISEADRLVVKNFASSPEAGANYLQERYPDKSFAYNPDVGDITEFDKQTGEERPIDPGLGYYAPKWGDLPKSAKAIAKEAILDAADIGTDMAIGIMGAKATALGALGGTVAAGPIGTIPGALALGGATDAALEVTRQAVGTALGIKDNINMKTVAMQGAFGGASTLLTGTGLSMLAFRRACTKPGTDQVINGLVEKTIKESFIEHGLVGSTLTTGKRIAGKAAQVTTGVAPSLYRKFVDPASRKLIRRLDSEGVKEIAKETGEEAYGAWRTKLSNWGQRLAEARAGDGKTPVKVSLEKVQKVYGDEISKLEKLAQTPDDHSTVASLKKEFDDLFLDRNKFDMDVSARNGIIDQQKKTMANMKAMGDEAKKRFQISAEDISIRKKEAEIARKKYKIAGEKDPSALEKMDKFELQIKEDEKAIKEAHVKFVSGFKIPAMKEPPEPAKQYITHVEGEQFSNLLQSIKESGKTWGNIEAKSKAKDTAMRLAYDARKTLNAELDLQLKHLPGMRAEYRRLKNAETFVDNLYTIGVNGEKNFDEATYRYLADRGNDRIAMEKLLEFDKEHKLALFEKARLLQAHKALGKNPASTVSPITSTAKFLGASAVGGVGGLIGASVFGQSFGSYVAGAMAAGAIAMVGLSPAAWKAYYGAGRGIKPFIEATYKSMKAKSAIRGAARSMYTPTPSSPQGGAPVDDLDSLSDEELDARLSELSE